MTSDEGFLVNIQHIVISGLNLFAASGMDLLLILCSFVCDAFISNLFLCDGLFLPLISVD